VFRYDVTIHRHGDRTVVAKAPADEASADALRYEARMLERIRHPHVVELVAGPDDDDPSLITALAGSDDLAIRPPTDITAARSALRSMAATLADLHRMGFAHGAVAAEHFVSGPGGRLTLCSFRRAREISGEASAGSASDGRALAGVIRWWLATIPTTRADRRVADQLAEVADALESEDPPTLARVVTLLEAPRRQPERGRRRRGATRPAPSGPSRPVAPSARAAAFPRRELVAQGVVAAFHLAALALLVLLQPTSLGGPRAAVVGLVWAAAVLAAGVGAVTGAATLVLQVREVPALRRLANRTSVPWARRAAAALATFGVTATSVASFGGGAGSTLRAAAVTAPVDPSPDRSGAGSTTTSSTSTTSTSTTTTTTSTSTTTTTALPPSVVALASTPAGEAGAADVADIPDEAQDPSSDEATRPAPAERTWTVRSGDHLWSIASRALSERLDRRPTTDELLPYWASLIEANRDRLVDPANPDLILAGQVFVLPEG